MRRLPKCPACATKAPAFGGVEIPASQVQHAYMAALDGSFAAALRTQDIIAGFAPG